MRRPPVTWKSAIYYGEVFGFVAAWVVGIAVLAQLAPEADEPKVWGPVASATPRDGVTR